MIFVPHPTLGCRFLVSFDYVLACHSNIRHKAKALQIDMDADLCQNASNKERVQLRIERLFVLRTK